MSGGVDSSVAAALLVEAGHEVVGVTMKTFCYTDVPGHPRSCCGMEGIDDARSVAHVLGIPHYVFDVEDEFTHDVIDDFVAEYARGRTPNPCVRCNAYTKFRDLLARGRALECDAIASGHYVRIEHGPTGSVLRRGLDPAKDQAYFLWGLPREMLPSLLFPLGELTKREVRERARALGLRTADKAESQEICFVPTGDYRDLLRRKLGPTHPALEPGKVVNLRGEQIGEHRGYAGFTIGQRRGLGGGHPDPLYVLEIRPETRTVVVGPRVELFHDAVDAAELNWLAAPPEIGMRVNVQLRYRAPKVPARIRAAGSTLSVTLDEAQPAITPGQSIVVCEGDRVLGGGRISASFRTSRRTPPSPSALRV